MAQESVFRGVLTFFNELGIYDVILPFLLVFTIVFAILEKTRIFGTDKVGGEEVTKKNINSIVSFVVAFFVVASTKLVAVISETLANTVLLLILGVSFMLLISVFYGTGEISLKDRPGWMNFFMVAMFVGIVLIFLNALGWLKNLINFLRFNFGTDWVASLILIVVVLIFMFLIVKEPKGKKGEK